MEQSFYDLSIAAAPPSNADEVVVSEASIAGEPKMAGEDLDQFLSYWE
jgi:hypothetical protein